MNKYAVASYVFDRNEHELKIIEANDPVSALVIVLGDAMAPYTAGNYTLEEILEKLYDDQAISARVLLVS